MRELSRMWDNLVGPGMLYTLERHFWLELWRAPVVDAIDEHGIETRRYGPVQVTVAPNVPQTPLLNLVLGAAEPDAVRDGHLAEALDWVESLGIDCRIPIRPEFEESGAAEDHLNQRGYRRTASLAKYVRDASPPDFPEPPGIEVVEFTEETEGFSDYFVEGLGLESAAFCFFDGLPGRRPWRCYVAIDESEYGTGAAMMMLHHEVAQLGFAAVNESARGGGSHMALLRRRILDAAAARCQLLFADVEEPVDGAGLSPAAANLERAGFRLAAVRPVWRPPAGSALEPNDEELNEEELDDEEDFGGED
jgi:hypothetical protein